MELETLETNLVKAIQQAFKEAREPEPIEEAVKTPGFWEKLKSIVEPKKKEEPKQPPVAGGFKVYVDSNNQQRWLSVSSNAFEDLDKELFTTKALEEAIEYADKTGERGPLLFYHVPSAEIGQCDYQGMAGRFLVESGTFDDTPLGRKAVEHFINSDEEHQVSIGYQYIDGDEKDGQYDWLRVKERSVCPAGTAANPWTEFKVIGENPMDARKVEALENIFGKELAAGVIASAEEKTKELEGSVRFKEKVEEAVEETLTVDGLTLEEAEAAAVKAVKESFEKAKKPPMDEEEEEEMAPKGEKEEEAPPTFSTEQLTQLASLIGELTTQVSDLSSVKEAVVELQSQVKELKASEDEKVANIITPRWTLPGGIKPSESDDTLMKDQDKVKEVLNQGEKEGNQNPAAAYVSDLLGAVGRI